MKTGAVITSSAISGMLRAVVDEAETFHEDAGEHVGGAVSYDALDACVPVERVDQHVERIEERDVAEVVEAAEGDRLFEQLVADHHVCMMP